MKIDTTSKKAMLFTCIIIILAVLVFSAIYIPINLKNSNAWTNGNMTDANRLEVPELFSIDGALQGKNVIELNKYLFNSASVPTTLSSNLTATDIRNSTNGGKAAGQSVIVTLGGMQWTVTYVSKAKNGDLIATLWLTENATTSTFGNSSSYYGKDAPTSGVPTNMYGTSYIRAESLNNGGKYINITSNTANPTSVGSTASQETNHVFAPFTMSNATTYKGLTTFIVKPSQVSWQENGQSTKALFNWGNNCSNDNWTDTKSGATADDQFYSAGYNYAGKSFSGYGNSTWANDYIWLPSIVETGYNDTTKVGLWATNQNERSNSTYSWLRSANNGISRYAYLLYADGSSYRYADVKGSNALRPALHFNLSLATPKIPNVSLYVINNTSNQFEDENGSYGSNYPVSADKITIQFFDKDNNLALSETMSFMLGDSEIFVGDSLNSDEFYRVKILTPTFLRYAVTLSWRGTDKENYISSSSFMVCTNADLDIIIDVIAITDDSWLTDYHAP